MVVVDTLTITHVSKGQASFVHLSAMMSRQGLRGAPLAARVRSVGRQAVCSLSTIARAAASTAWAVSARWLSARVTRLPSRNTLTLPPG